jgi:hypothetical protein
MCSQNDCDSSFRSQGSQKPPLFFPPSCTNAHKMLGISCLTKQLLPSVPWSCQLFRNRWKIFPLPAAGKFWIKCKQKNSDSLVFLNPCVPIFIRMCFFFCQFQDCAMSRSDTEGIIMPIFFHVQWPAFQ